ncbi:acyltransferase domain-containing protein [Nocardia vulneris]|uniref:type I polyketide synthase n=1 Tax=Nocardia vulneris TaxID=1141657 RepID=UPI0030CE48F5
MSAFRTHETGAEPIAIIGMACRYPGNSSSPQAFWDFLSTGATAVTDFPADRGWDLDRLRADPARAGASAVHRGGFLDAAAFDAAFFGISPREAAAMHPEQRLLLEVAWEACEHAMLDPHSLRDTDTGVYAAQLSTAYGPPLHLAPEGAAGLMLTGNIAAAISGRIAYTLGVTGPAISIDTASSGSLVAIHLAVQALRARECARALAGGVSVMPTPGFFTEFTRQQGLAPDGRAKPFAADADGTVWSEGAGMILLARLSDAQANGHRVLAVIRGSAVNSDGASAGLTAPSATAQQQLITRALADAGLSAADVAAVEAHGSGTRAGDRAEATALVATYGVDRARDQPLRVGSVKSNIGHAQAAAGVAGLIKSVLALQHEKLPGLVRFGTPSPEVDWATAAVLPLAETAPWPRGDRPRRCGVSSFGVAGTNAHVIVEEAPEFDAADPTEAAPADVLAWVISARSATALRAQAARLLATAETERPADIGYSLAVTRSRFDHRAVIVGTDRAELVSGLEAVVRGAPAPQVVRGTAWSDPQPVFVFPGQGGQWPGMATALAKSSPEFAGHLADCAAALRPYLPWSLSDVLDGVAGAPSLERVDVVQPVLWAVMVALARTWQGYGVEPAAVVGHSQGEIAAACVAGALSLDDGARVVARRSQVVLALSGTGAMLSLGLGAEAARKRMARWGTRLDIAAINGPGAVVVCGAPAAIAQLQAECERDDIRARPINADYASHSSHVDPVERELRETLAPVRPRTGAMPLYSTVTGAPIRHDALDAGYWWQNLRRPVQFEAATRSLLDAGHHVFIEISPHPVLAFGLEDTIEAAGADAAVLATLRRDDGGPDRLTMSLAQAEAHGVAVDWHTYFAPVQPRRIPLPTYAFQRRRYWLDAPGVPAADAAPVALTDPEPAAPATTPRDIRELVAREIAAVLGLDTAAEVNTDLSFKALGFESMTSVELRNRLSVALGRRLPTTLIYDYPAPRALADHLAGLGDDPSAAPDRDVAPAPTTRGPRGFDDMDGAELVRLALGKEAR